MLRTLYRILSIAGDVKAAGRGPAPYARRVARRHANRSFNRALRKLLKP